MTKFIDNAKKKATANTTVFEYCIYKGRMDKARVQPDEYDYVEYLGTDMENISLFKAWDKEITGFTFFTGTKGDEFNN